MSMTPKWIQTWDVPMQLAKQVLHGYSIHGLINARECYIYPLHLPGQSFYKALGIAINIENLDGVV